MIQRLLFSLTLVIWGSSFHAVGADQLCDANSGVLIDYTTGGIVVQVPFSPINGTYDIIPIPGYTSPLPCQEDTTLCRPLIIQGNFLVISVVGNLVFVNLDAPSQDPYVVPIPPNRSCSPTNLIFTDEDTPILWVACINNSSSSLMYLPYLIFVNDGEITASFINLTQVSLSESSTGFSESILLDICSVSGFSRLYVVHNGYIWRFPVTGGAVREFVRNDVQLENCSSVSYIEHSDTSEFITIHCSSGVVVSYSVCSEDVQYHNLTGDGIPYSCGTGSVRYKADTIEVLDTDGSAFRQFNHTLGAVTYGRCSGNFFAVVTAGGSLYGIQLDGTAAEGATKLADVCDDAVCVRPAFSSAGILVYDVSNSVLLSVDTEVCADPVVGMSYSLQRPLYVVISSTRSRVCDCPVNATTSPVPPTTLAPAPSTVTIPDNMATSLVPVITSSVANTVATPPMVDSSLENPVPASASDNPPMLDEGNDSNSKTTTIIIVVVLVFLAAAAAVVIVMVIAIIIRRSNKHRTATETPPSSPIKINEFTPVSESNGNRGQMVNGQQLESPTVFEPDQVQDKFNDRISTDDQRNNLQSKLNQHFNH